MYRLLIVDDEKEIVDWLYDLFCELPELELDVYKALTGYEALDILGRTKIDVVVSDIRMPGLNGLQLLERIRNLWPLCRVVFLTGFHEFDYIYAAIKYKGVDYLLKTEEDSEIVNRVRSAIAELERNIHDRELMDKVHEYVERALPILRMDTVKKLILEPEAGSASTQEMLNELKLPLRRDRSVYLAAGRFDSFPANDAPDFGARMAISVKLRADETFGSNFMNVCLIHEGNIGLVWLLQPTADIPAENECDGIYLPLLGGALEGLQDFSRDALSLTMSFVFSSKSVQWEELESRYAAISKLMSLSSRLGGELLLSDRDVQGSAQEKSIRESVDRIKQYIKGHLTEDLSLVRLAEISYFNPSYLSRLFKQASGQNITDYISGLRIDRAKTLMADHNKKISDISRALGFDSQHYFSRFFKKYTGLTPQEYKESMIRK